MTSASLTNAFLIPSPISGVYLQPLDILDTDGGPVLHMYRPMSPMYAYLAGLGKHCAEVYFSEINPGAVKAWKRHTQQQQLFAVPVGQVHFVLYDGHVLAEYTLGRPDNYALLTIPPGIWYGFAAVGGRHALICNCPDIPHDPKECERLPRTTDTIPYHWE